MGVRGHGKDLWGLERVKEAGVARTTVVGFTGGDYVPLFGASEPPKLFRPRNVPRSSYINIIMSMLIMHVMMMLMMMLMLNMMMMMMIMLGVLHAF